MPLLPAEIQILNERIRELIRKELKLKVIDDSSPVREEDTLKLQLILEDEVIHETSVSIEPRWERDHGHGGESYLDGFRFHIKD